MQVSFQSTSFVRTRQDVQRFARFAAVGMLGTLIDVVLFMLLSGWLGLPTLFANTLSYSVGIINNYALNRVWTFGDSCRKATGKQFVQFALVSLSALALNNLLVLMLATPLGTLVAAPQWGYLLAKLCATVVGFCWNFFANRSWTFNQTPERGAAI